MTRRKPRHKRSTRLDLRPAPTLFDLAADLGIEEEAEHQDDDATDPRMSALRRWADHQREEKS